MSTCVYVDNNVWDFLFKQQIDLSAELPSSEFTICITREAEFEISTMPEDLRLYVARYIKFSQVETMSYFGFGNDSRHSPDEQRYSGWNEGRWATEKELQFIKKQKKTVIAAISVRAPQSTGLFSAAAPDMVSML